MSKFNELEIFKASYDLSMEIFQFTGKMSRNFKYTLGERLGKDVIALLLCIYRANSTKEGRYALLQTGRETVEEIRLLLRMSKDLQLLALNRFIAINELIEMISKQMSGWQRASKDLGHTKAVQARLF